MTEHASRTAVNVALEPDTAGLIGGATHETGPQPNPSAPPPTAPQPQPDPACAQVLGVSVCSEHRSSGPALARR